MFTRYTELDYFPCCFSTYLLDFTCLWYIRSIFSEKPESNTLGKHTPLIGVWGKLTSESKYLMHKGHGQCRGKRDA